MIPKIIHYCWFSGDKKPALIRKCIRSWKKHLPDYEIRCWDGNSFDFDSLQFTREAMSVKKYAAAADYVRLFALFNYGGIYLDSDVEIFKSLNPFLENKFFSGYEYFDKYQIEAGIIGSVKGFPYLKECMEYYESTPFIHENGEYDININQAPDILTNNASNHGYVPSGDEQLTENGIHLYPQTVFSNEAYACKTYGFQKEINTTELFALHHNMGTWTNVVNQKGAFWRFCWEHNMLVFYKKIESCRVKILNSDKK
ncbi:MAG: glycosyl transferase [Bacteroidales bacterium]|nr:glycosyl transferase [Bacteroidales bacterium]